MKKVKLLSLVLGKMMLVFCLFAMVGLSNAKAQTKTFKQSDDALSALEQEAKLLAGALANLSQTSTLYKYDAAKITAIKSISVSILAGRSTEESIEELFTTSPMVQTEQTSFANRLDATQARQELTTLLQN